MQIARVIMNADANYRNRSQRVYVRCSATRVNVSYYCELAFRPAWSWHRANC